MIAAERKAAAEDEGGLRLRRWLNRRCGLHFADSKAEALLQRLARIMENFAISDFGALARELERATSGPLVDAVVHAASTNHTYFFREPHVLDYFRDVALAPRYAVETRIWSAAASTGDEAHTLAIIAAERFGRRQAREKVAILGTDISAAVLATAEEGVYGAANLEHSPPEIVERYFSKESETAWRVADDIRSMCLFRRLNLSVAPYPFQERFHIVFCRNVLYYFDQETQRAVVDAIWDVTEPGGYLFTSVTVSLRELGSRWSMIQSGVYRKSA